MRLVSSIAVLVLVSAGCGFFDDTYTETIVDPNPELGTVSVGSGDTRLSFSEATCLSGEPFDMSLLSPGQELTYDWNENDGVKMSRPGQLKVRNVRVDC